MSGGHVTSLEMRSVAERAMANRLDGRGGLKDESQEAHVPAHAALLRVADRPEHQRGFGRRKTSAAVLRRKVAPAA